MTALDKNISSFWNSGENPEVQQKNSKNQSREVLAGTLLLLIVVLPESLIYSGNIKIAFLLYIGTLIALSIISVFVKEQEIRNICQVFLLLPILRLMNFSVPFFPESPLLFFVFVYSPVLIPLTIVTISQKLEREQLGFNLKNIWYYLPISILIGLALGYGESILIKTIPLIPDFSLINILMLTFVMVLFVGVTEEALFRSILQTRINEIFGARRGLVLSSLVFGFMHAGYGTSNEILYASFTGFILGYLFYKTRSLPFVALTHGFINVFSFGILPLLGYGSGFF